MALDKQITIYSIDTGNLYSERERRLHNRNAEFRRERRYLKNALTGVEELMSAVGYQECDFKELSRKNFDKVNYICGTSDLIREYYRITSLIRHKANGAVKTKKALTALLHNKVEQNILTSGKDHTRELRVQDLTDKHLISLFDSSLSRAFGLEKNEFTDNLIVLQVYYFDIFKDMMYYGFSFRGEKYRYLTSSAGQIRKKKAVFIKESAWNQHQKTIMCGLTIDEINRQGGNNVNKYLAYMALANSATDVWEDFDIDKCIVIPDFESDVFGTYDFIDDEDYSITRKTGNVFIPHTDGVGMILPKAFGKQQKNKMVRLPWIKGLLGVYDFVLHIKEHGYSPIIRDIYGKEHDVIAEDIQVIFTESQFKMAKFYSDWNDYKHKFNVYGCSAGYCNEEEDRIKKSHINYQMLQTLTDITDDEIRLLTSSSVERLTSLCDSEENIKAVFGVTIYNNNKSYLQQAIDIYPSLLNDTYLKDVIRDIKNRLIKMYKAGKLEIDGKYTFILPDFYAACNHWFGGIENPDGLLNDGEIFCNLYRTKYKLDCLRSPHLYREHAVRYNTAYNGNPEKRELISKWFTTNALYTSSKDLISKILQCDVDGDKALVIGDELFISIAERNMKDIVPLYYNMKKAQPVLLNNESIYKGLNNAFVGGNIGIYSNNISKIWNSNVFISGTEQEKQDAIAVIKLLCMENNFTIDFTKTLYKPTRPKDIDARIKSFTKNKVPNFFIYAKDKEPEQVAKTNKSFVNKLEKLIPDPKLDFRKAGLGKIDYKMLMHNPETRIIPEIVDKYLELNQTYHFKINMKDEGVDNLSSLAHSLRQQMSTFGKTEYEISDILVRHLYGNNKRYKEMLWFCYGHCIKEALEKNIPKPQTRIIQCSDCGEWFETLKGNRTVRCEMCQTEHKRAYEKLKKRKQRGLSPF